MFYSLYSDRLLVNLRSTLLFLNFIDIYPIDFYGFVRKILSLSSTENGSSELRCLWCTGWEGITEEENADVLFTIFPALEEIRFPYDKLCMEDMFELAFLFLERYRENPTPKNLEIQVDYRNEIRDGAEHIQAAMVEKFDPSIFVWEVVAEEGSENAKQIDIQRGNAKVRTRYFP